MTEAKENSINLVVLTPELETGEKLVQDACGGNGTELQSALFGALQVHFSLLAGTPPADGSWEKAIQGAGALVLIIRHIDMVSMEKAKKLYHLLPSDTVVPSAMLISRMSGEVDFKMSCPFCGQKLWVRDSDVDKRGRCPNCTKAFTLPHQTRHLRSQLKCPDAVPVTHVYQGNAASSRDTLRNLLAKTHGDILEITESADPEVLKRSTVRVEIQDPKNDSK